MASNIPSVQTSPQKSGLGAIERVPPSPSPASFLWEDTHRTQSRQKPEGGWVRPGGLPCVCVKEAVSLLLRKAPRGSGCCVRAVAAGAEPHALGSRKRTFPDKDSAPVGSPRNDERGAPHVVRLAISVWKIPHEVRGVHGSCAETLRAEGAGGSGRAPSGGILRVHGKAVVSPQSKQPEGESKSRHRPVPLYRKV